MDLAGRHGAAVSVFRQDDEAAFLVQCLKLTAQYAVAKPDGNRGAESGGLTQPEAADVGDAAAAVPDQMIADPGVRKRRKQAFGGHETAKLVQRGDGIRQARGRRRYIDAEADDNGEPVAR